MSGLANLTRLIRVRHGGLCDACIAADLALPGRRVHWTTAMLGKAAGYQRVHRHCPRCAALRSTRKAA